jgi:hypothetical protein
VRIVPLLHKGAVLGQSLEIADASMVRSLEGDFIDVIEGVKHGIFDKRVEAMTLGAKAVAQAGQDFSNAANDIRALIGKNSTQVADGVRLANDTGRSFGTLVEGARAVATRMAEISKGIDSQ